MEDAIDQFGGRGVIHNRLDGQETNVLRDVAPRLRAQCWLFTRLLADLLVVIEEDDELDGSLINEAARKRR